MKISKTLYIRNRKQWRSWLSKNYDNKNEIWLIYYRKSAGKPRIPYNDAVEEALCFGWIDSIIKHLDDERFVQRFSPRLPKSQLSEMNKERIRRLIRNKKMTKAGLNAIDGIFDHKKDKKHKFVIDLDILKAIKENKQAWKNFQKFSEGYKRVRIGYIKSQGRHGDALFEKSLRHFVKMTARNKKFGQIR